MGSKPIFMTGKLGVWGEMEAALSDISGWFSFRGRSALKPAAGVTRAAARSIMRNSWKTKNAPAR
jgi:hypothetical protein